jgi:hypothetical protein
MKITKLHTLLATAVALAVALPFAAQAAPTITVTGPASGSVFSKEGTETIPVTGTVSFDTPAPAVDRTFYFRRELCGNVAGANRRLSVVKGSETIGCGAPNSAVTPIVDNYPAVDGLPLLIDASKQAEVTVVESAFVADVGGGVGQEKIEALLTGTTVSGETKTIGTGSETQLVTPDKDEVTHTFSFALTDPGEVLTALNLRITTSGTLGRSYTNYAGASFLKLPIFDVGTVQVSGDSATFSAVRTVTATVAPDGTWTADVPTPSVGARKIYARAVQGTNKVSVDPISVTIIP